MSDNQVELKVNGVIYGGWISASVEGGIEQIAGSFSLNITERWSGQETPRPIRRDDKCELLINRVPVITGHVDDVTIDFDSTSHSVSITGRDATGDLVDCSAIHKSGQWAKATLDKIVRDICAPFGIKVKVAAPIGTAFATYSIQEGETAHEAIERACRMKAVLPVSDGLGNLVLTRAGSGAPVASLVEGENILVANGTFSNKERFSHYIIKGQDRGTSDDDFDTPETHTQVRAESRDDFIRRYRPVIVIAEERGPHATYKERAEWERNVRRGRSARASITVQGWAHEGGLWQPNTLVRLRSAFLGVDTDLLISARTFTLDEQGSRTVLTLSGREAFDLLAGIKSTRLSKAIKGKDGAAAGGKNEPRKKDNSGDWSEL